MVLETDLHGSVEAGGGGGGGGGGGVGENVTRFESFALGTVGHGEGRMVLAKYTSICFCLSSLSGLEEKEGEGEESRVYLGGGVEEVAPILVGWKVSRCLIAFTVRSSRKKNRGIVLWDLPFKS